jgi:hypothetical protein
MVFANIEDHRKPFLSAMFAIISLSTATFVYLAVDGKTSIRQCHLQDGASSNSASDNTTTTTAAPGTTTSTTTSALNSANFLVSASTTFSPDPSPSGHELVDVDKYLSAVTGGVVICALLAATSVAVVLSVYCRSPNILKIMFILFCVLSLALFYPMVVFGQAINVGPDCKSVGIRLVPATVGLLVVAFTTLLFFADTLRKIRSGEESGVMARLVGN